MNNERLLASCVGYSPAKPRVPRAYSTQERAFRGTRNPKDSSLNQSRAADLTHKMDIRIQMDTQLPSKPGMSRVSAKLTQIFCRISLVVQ
jgi:hypothetical protein